MSDGERLILGHPTNAELTRELAMTPFRAGGRGWRIAFAVTGLLSLYLLFMVGYTVFFGIGLWGNNIPVAWGFAIINFVWWIGIGHAGTFISAILLLGEQKWRTSINRFAEAMTLFAVIQAGLFPLIHLGRPWFAYWLFPYPATMKVWPQVKSSLPWDAAAVSTYFTVSLMFWYLGLIPDLAAARDTAPTRRKRRIYGLFALGWRGSARHWRHYRVVYLLLAGLATPLVLSVHSVVSADFAIGIVPGWHSTIFPPLFVAGAIYSGFVMVITLAVPVRKIFHLERVITMKHFDSIAKMALATASMVLFGYITEFFIAWYSGSPYDLFQFFHARPMGPGAIIFWMMLGCNVIGSQLLWFKKVRSNIWLLWALSLVMQVGMWSERFVIVVISLERDFLPSAWKAFIPTWVDLSILLGTIGFFAFLFILFMRLVPVIAQHEVKELNHELAEEREKGVRGGGHA